MFMSVVGDGFEQWDDAIVTGHWQSIGSAKADAPGGKAALGSGAGTGFLVTHAPLTGTGVLGCDPLTPPKGHWAFRIDEVAFPVGAVAHRHIHSGSGWRHLVSGSLRIEAETGTRVMAPGDSWFEPAATPVRAVALQSEGVTRFVRCMAIPASAIGASTFQLCDGEDAKLPRLQVTHRHLDHPVQVDAG